MMDVEIDFMRSGYCEIIELNEFVLLYRGIESRNGCFVVATEVYVTSIHFLCCVGLILHPHSFHLLAVLEHGLVNISVFLFP